MTHTTTLGVCVIARGTHTLADLRARLTVMSCRCLCPPGSVLSSRNDVTSRLPGRVLTYFPTYLPSSNYLSTQLSTCREGGSYTHSSVHLLLLIVFIFGKMGGKDTYELGKAYSFKRNGATAAAMLCYLHGRTFYFIPALFCCLYISWGSYEYLPLQSTHFRTPDLTGVGQISLD